MLRFSRRWAAGGNRVGVFPLHLDPPTLQHRAVFSRLLADPALGLERIILLPNTQRKGHVTEIPLSDSLHLAAMAGLAMKDLPQVEVDFAALENPDSKLPRVRDLMECEALRHKATLISWVPDLPHLLEYLGQDFLDRRRTILLRPNDFPEEEIPPGVMPGNNTVLSVDKISGSETRRLLADGETDPKLMIPPPVLRYMESHSLYRDFRKPQRFFYGTGHSNRAVIQQSQGTSNSHAVALEGLIPRLLLLADEFSPRAAMIERDLQPLAVRPGEEPDLIVPIGGDGFMMRCIREHWSRFIPFFGVNAGHVGYLLNDAASIDEMINAPLCMYQAPMLYVCAEGEDGTQHEELAFNDAWMERATGQTALISIHVNGQERLHRVRADGVLVATPAGSTAYALALGASPLPVNSTILQLVGSNVVKPSRWKPVHLHQDTVVELVANDTEKRPCSAYADGVPLGPCRHMSIRASRVAGVQLAFNPSSDLQSKLYALQFPQH